MKLNITIRPDNIIIPYATEDIEKVDGLNKKAIYVVELGKVDERSLKQNNALHRYFSLVARELNKNGFEIQSNLNMELNWNTTRVKELIWKEFQKVVLGKESTRLLTKKELTQIYDYVNRYTSEQFGISIEFPNREQLENKETKWH